MEFLTSQCSVALAKGASIALPVTMLFSAITLESLLFSADRIGFFAILSRIAINSRSFHSTLMLELTGMPFKKSFCGISDIDCY